MPATPGAPLLAKQSASALADLIANRSATARQTLEALLEPLPRPERPDASPATMGLSQPRFEEARREADEADAVVDAGADIGPLHGVPVSIKDCFAVQGMRTTLGIPGHATRPDAVDAPLVARLRGAGAILLGKTNVPQGMMLHECDNPLFGRTLHPTDPDRGPGGSSGGEAALIAAGVSPLGLGSDLGGSIRQPAHSTGVCGLKPTGGRLTIVGSQRAMPGQRALRICPGPMARSVADLDLAMRVLLDTTHAPRQPDEVDAPWRDWWRVETATLRVAYWTDDAIFPPAVAVGRAVEQAANLLREAGADVRRVALPNPDEMLMLYLGLISADGMRSLGRLLEGVARDPQVRRQTRLARVAGWRRRALAVALGWAGQPELRRLVQLTGPKSSDEYWRLIEQADAYRATFWDRLAEAFGGGPVDALLTPPHALPALRHGAALHLMLAASHCFLANLIDASAGVVPVTRVTPEDEREELAKPRRAWNLVDHFRRENARGSAGLPVGVQVTSPPWREDLTLAVMAELEARAAFV